MFVFATGYEKGFSRHLSAIGSLILLLLFSHLDFPVFLAYTPRRTSSFVSDANQASQLGHYHMHTHPWIQALAENFEFLFVFTFTSLIKVEIW